MVARPLLKILLLVSAIEVSFADSCPPDFGGRCSCGKTNYNGRERFLVNCTNSQFQDAAMLEKLPVETEVVIFRGCIQQFYLTPHFYGIYMF